MTRREFSWTESEQHAARAYAQVLRAEHLAFSLPSAMDKAPIRQNGRPRYFKGDGSVQEVTRSIKVFLMKNSEDYVEVCMVGQRWSRPIPRTYWHVTEVVYHSGARASEYRYDWTSSVHDPHWSAWPLENDLRKVMPDGQLQRVA